MQCPYCAGEVETKARKCKHCGEWLDQSGRSSLAAPDGVTPLDNSRVNVYKVHLKRDGKPYKPCSIIGENEASVRSFVVTKYPDSSIDEKRGIRTEEPGKYTCPNCRSKYTNCNREIGCAVAIIIFISFGLGFIMIPFLPYHCECKLCGYAWKA